MKQHFINISEKQRNDFFKKFLDDNPDYCYMISADGKLLDINKSALKILGLNKQKVLGKNALPIIYDEGSVAVAQKYFKQWQKEGKLNNCELNIKSANGMERTVLLNAGAIFSTNGVVEATISMQRDITDIRSPEASVSLNEKYLKTVLNTVPVGIGFVENYKIKYTNDELFNMVGYDKNSLWDTDIRNSEPFKKLIQIFPQTNKKTLEKKEFLEIETKLNHKNGSFLEGLFKIVSFDKNTPKKNFTFSVIDITNRNKDITELEQKEHYYRALLNQIHDDVIVIDRDYSITDINNSMLSTTGHKKENVIGKPCYEISHRYNQPCDEEGDLCPVQEVFKTGQPISALHKHYSENGEKRWVDLLFSPLKDEKGKVIRAIESARDVTDLYKMQESIQKSEKKYKDLVEKSGIGILIDAPDGKIKYFNDKICRIFGYNKNEMKKQSLQTLIHPEDKEWVLKIHSKRMQNKNVSSSYEFRGVRKNGKTIHLHVDSVMIKENKRIIGTRSYIQDITQRVKADLMLQESEEKYRLIVENAHDGIEITQDDKIIFTNERFAEMLGYSKTELQNIKFSKIYTKEAIEALMKRAKQREHNLSVPVYYETTFRKKDGSIIDVEIKYEIIKYKGKPATFAIVRDITESKKAEQELRKRNKELEIFNDATVGRELKILELKKEVNRLLSEQNKKAKYTIPK